MNKKEKGKKGKKIGLILLLVIIVVLIILFVSYLKNDNNIIINNKLSKLEQISINKYINEIDIGKLLENYEIEEDKQVAKIQYIIDEYAQKNDKDIVPDEIYEKYKEIFITQENEENDLMTKITEQSFRNEEDFLSHINGENIIIVKEINRINEEEYEVKIDIAQNIRKEDIINYYQNLEEEQKNGIDILELYQDEENENEPIDITKYINKDNYKQISNEIQSVKITIKIENDEMKILDFNKE